MVQIDVLRDAPRNWRVVAGLAFMYVWTWLHYWGGPYSLRGFTIELTNARWGANVVMVAAVLGAVLVASCRMPGRRLLDGLRVASLVTGVVGTVLALVLVLAPPGGDRALFALAVLSGFCTGACEGCLLALWCTVTSLFGTRTALTYNVFAMVGSGFLFVLCAVLPSAFAYTVGMACPVAGYLCSMGRSRYEDAFAPGGTAFEGSPGTSAGERPARLRPLVGDRSFLVLVAIALVFGASSGFINASFEVVPKEDYWLSCYGVVAGTIAAAALTVLAAFVLKMDAWQLVFRTSLPLMAVAYLLFPYEAFWYVGPGIHALGFQYFFITFWSLLGSKQLRRGVPAICSVSLGLLAVQGGAAVGLCVWNLACVGIDVDGLRLVSGIAAFLILVVAVSFERPQFGWGSVRPGSAQATQEGGALHFAGALERIRATYGLSPRETDVCGLLGRGRNRQFVADELGISLETAKSHATNVYRKLGIHSQQELLDVIEATCDTLARESLEAR